VSFLLDTNVVSELSKPRPNSYVVAWFDSVSELDLYLSAVVLGEIRRGVERLRPRDPTYAALLDDWLSQLRDEYGERTIPVTPDIAEEWGRLNAVRTLPAIDAFLAATANTLGHTLVTRNTRDFAGTGVQLFNPFQPAT
jgi:toxin FitB